MLKHIGEHRLEYMFLFGVIIAVFGCALLMMGFWVSPVGSLDSSVLVAVGEVFTFAGSVLGISATYKSNLNKLKEELKENKDTSANE